MLCRSTGVKRICDPLGHKVTCICRFFAHVVLHNENYAAVYLLHYFNKPIFGTKYSFMLRTVLLSFFMLGWMLAEVHAQGMLPPTTGVGILYNRETTFNIKLSTNRGIIPGIEFGRLRTYYKTTTFNLSIGEIKHVKEQRQSADPTLSRSFRPYVFGKQNNFIVVRSGWGAKRYFSEKARTKGVAVGMSYSIGPTLGLQKPYYLALTYQGDVPGNNRIVHEKYSEENANVFLNETRILGASPYSKGFNEIKVVPGGNATIAFHMDWGAFDEVVKAFEIGAMLDVFPRNIPIMVSEENTPFFFNFFINLQLGKRR